MVGIGIVDGRSGVREIVGDISGICIGVGVDPGDGYIYE